MLAKCLAREIKEDTSNRVTSNPWNLWKPLKTPEMVDTPEKVPEIPWKLGQSLKNMKTSLLKSAIRNNNIELQKNLACFQTYRTVVHKGELHRLQGCFRKYTDKEGI